MQLKRSGNLTEQNNFGCSKHLTYACRLEQPLAQFFGRLTPNIAQRNSVVLKLTRRHAAKRLMYGSPVGIRRSLAGTSGAPSQYHRV
jgi:hypothetical protein